MTKTFTLKRVGLTLAAFLLTLVASAQTVVFDFNSEKWVNDANGFTKELPEGTELEEGGVKMINHKRPLIRVTNVLKNQHLFVPRGNSIDFISPEGKPRWYSRLRRGISISLPMGRTFYRWSTITRTPACGKAMHQKLLSLA